MGMKRGKLILFSIIFLVIIIGFVSAQEEESEGFFFRIGKIFGSITGWVASIANVALDIQLDLNAPENFTITILNQSTGYATLNWSESNCGGYKIWYSNNVTEILQINYSNTNITNESSANVTLVGRSNTTWNDTTAPTVDGRYYALACYTGDFATTSDVKVGKWNVTIDGEDGSIGHSYLSFPLEQNMSINDIIPPNDFSSIHSIYDDNLNSFSFFGSWTGTLTTLEFGKGYYFYLFGTTMDITNAGRIPTGNVTKYISSGNNYTSLGWESISTNGSLTDLIVPPNDFASMYVIDKSQFTSWTSSVYFFGNWVGDTTEMEAGNGYLFGIFNSPTNFTYERNPY